MLLINNHANNNIGYRAIQIKLKHLEYRETTGFLYKNLVAKQSSLMLLLLLEVAMENRETKNTLHGCTFIIDGHTNKLDVAIDHTHTHTQNINSDSNIFFFTLIICIDPGWWCNTLSSRLFKFVCLCVWVSDKNEHSSLLLLLFSLSWWTTKRSRRHFLIVKDNELSGLPLSSYEVQWNGNWRVR